MSAISSDLGYIELLYYKFQDNFHDTPQKMAALEIIVNNQVYTNPPWNKVQELHQEYNKLKITYNLKL